MNLKLDPTKLLSHRFKVSENGYDPREVDTLLDLIIEDYLIFRQVFKQLYQENTQLKQEIDELNVEIKKSFEAAKIKRTTEQIPQVDKFSNLDLIKKIAYLENYVKVLEEKIPKE